MTGFRSSVMLLVACFCGPTAWSKPKAFIAPGFQFSQIDNICVAPVVDARLDKTETLRPLAGKYDRAISGWLHERGYEPGDCERGRWVLTISVEGVSTTAGYAILSGSLFDKQTIRVVWSTAIQNRPNPFPGFEAEMSAQYQAKHPDAPSYGEGLLFRATNGLIAMFPDRKKTKKRK
jgi:hypothetical protein